MNLVPSKQSNLYGLDKYLNELVNIYENDKLPTKILFSGQKGIGKSTLAYHLINYILSKNEDYSYDLENYQIQDKNKSFLLVQNKTSPNFNLVDVSPEKKTIEISQIRDLIIKMSKSSFNNKPRFILIDNIEFLNANSINALLKFLEEPAENIYFILINNNKKLLSTLKSRCLDYKLSLSNNESYSVCNKLLNINVLDLINEEYLDYYFTPGKICHLINFSKNYKIDLKSLNIKKFLSLMINDSLYKKDIFLKESIFQLIEFYLLKKISTKNIELFNYFLKKINNLKKFNLDEEIFFIEFRSKLLDE